MFKDYDQRVSQNNLYTLISEGEHGEQDFKYRITDARKIARTLSAFANTSGGRLLVGVRDNGSIAGVKDEDDIYMLESASEVFLKPALKLEVWAHDVDGKLVWEIEISEGKNKPYQVDEVDGLKALLEALLKALAEDSATLPRNHYEAPGSQAAVIWGAHRGFEHRLQLLGIRARVDQAGMRGAR